MRTFSREEAGEGGAGESVETGSDRGFLNKISSLLSDPENLLPHKSQPHIRGDRKVVGIASTLKYLIFQFETQAPHNDLHSFLYGGSRPVRCLIHSLAQQMTIVSVPAPTGLTD